MRFPGSAPLIVGEKERYARKTNSWKRVRGALLKSFLALVFKAEEFFVGPAQDGKSEVELDETNRLAKVLSWRRGVIQKSTRDSGLLLAPRRADARNTGFNGTDFQGENFLD